MAIVILPLMICGLFFMSASALLAGGAVTALPSPAIAAPFAPPSKLLSLCEALWHLDGPKEDALEAREDLLGYEAVRAERKAMIAEWNALLGQIADTPARTPEEVKAKARVLGWLPGATRTQANPNWESEIANSLVADLIGEGH